MQIYLSIVAGGGFELVGAGVTVKEEVWEKESWEPEEAYLH